MTRDEKKRIVLVYKPGRPGYDTVKGVKNAVVKAVDELKRKIKHLEEADRFTNELLAQANQAPQSVLSLLR